MSSGIRCVGWKPYQSGTLQGFAELVLKRTDIRVTDCPVHHSEASNSRWVSLFARPIVEKGELARDTRGRPRYASTIQFTTPERRKQFSEAAIRAIDQFIANEVEASGQTGDVSPLI